MIIVLLEQRRLLVSHLAHTQAREPVPRPPTLSSRSAAMASIPGVMFGAAFTLYLVLAVRDDASNDSGGNRWETHWPAAASATREEDDWPQNTVTWNLEEPPVVHTAWGVNCSGRSQAASSSNSSVWPLLPLGRPEMSTMGSATSSTSVGGGLPTAWDEEICFTLQHDEFEAAEQWMDAGVTHQPEPAAVPIPFAIDVRGGIEGEKADTVDWLEMVRDRRALRQPRATPSSSSSSSSHSLTVAVSDQRALRADQPTSSCSTSSSWMTSNGAVDPLARTTLDDEEEEGITQRWGVTRAGRDRWRNKNGTIRVRLREQQAARGEGGPLPTVDETEPVIFPTLEEGDTVDNIHQQVVTYYGENFKFQDPESPVEYDSTTAGETEGGTAEEQITTGDDHGGEADVSEVSDSASASSSTVGFWRHGVFIPRPRTDEELRSHRGGSGIKRTLKKEARMQAYFRGDWRPAWLRQYREEKARREAMDSPPAQHDPGTPAPSTHAGSSTWDILNTPPIVEPDVNEPPAWTQEQWDEWWGTSSTGVQGSDGWVDPTAATGGTWETWSQEEWEAWHAWSSWTVGTWETWSQEEWEAWHAWSSWTTCTSSTPSTSSMSTSTSSTTSPSMVANAGLFPEVRPARDVDAVVMMQLTGAERQRLQEQGVPQREINRVSDLLDSLEDHQRAGSGPEGRWALGCLLQRATEAIAAMDMLAEVMARRIVPRGYLPVRRVPQREEARWRYFSWARQAVDVFVNTADVHLRTPLQPGETEARQSDLPQATAEGERGEGGSSDSCDGLGSPARAASSQSDMALNSDGEMVEVEPHLPEAGDPPRGPPPPLPVHEPTTSASSSSSSSSVGEHHPLAPWSPHGIWRSPRDDDEEPQGDDEVAVFQLWEITITTTTTTIIEGAMTQELAVWRCVETVVMNETERRLTILSSTTTTSSSSTGALASTPANNVRDAVHGQMSQGNLVDVVDVMRRLMDRQRHLRHCDRLLAVAIEETLQWLRLPLNARPFNSRSMEQEIWRTICGQAQHHSNQAVPMLNMPAMSPGVLLQPGLPTTMEELRWVFGAEEATSTIASFRRRGWRTHMAGVLGDLGHDLPAGGPPPEGDRRLLLLQRREEQAVPNWPEQIRQPGIPHVLRASPRTGRRRGHSRRPRRPLQPDLVADPLVVVPGLVSSGRDPDMTVPAADVEPAPSAELLAPAGLDDAADGVSHVQRRLRERSRSRDGE